MDIIGVVFALIVALIPWYIGLRVFHAPKWARCLDRMYMGGPAGGLYEVVAVPVWRLGRIVYWHQARHRGRIRVSMWGRSANLMAVRVR